VIGTGKPSQKVPRKDDRVNRIESESKTLGEVISTSYSSFTVESYELNSTPPLGALVAAQSVLGVVCAARTEGLGPISARGSQDGDEASVYSLYPDLQRTLRSQFTALVVGCYDEDKGSWPETSAIYAYPECPPRVHYKCRMVSDAELVAFTSQPDYLRLLLQSTEASNIDQVLIHLIIKGYKARGNDHDWLYATAEYLGRQLKGQYDRLLAILKTLDALTQGQPVISGEISQAIGRVRL
jgi:hypothetical protein